MAIKTFHPDPDSAGRHSPKASCIPLSKTKKLPENKSMRPKLTDKEKRKIVVRFLMTKEEKIRLDSLVKQGKYGCTSDFLRFKIFDQSRRKTISLDEETKSQLKRLDYELNKIGVNLNQLSKRMNSFAGYRVDDNDRLLLKQAFEMMRNCLVLLQKYLR
jgi:hypothetical protein